MNSVNQKVETLFTALGGEPIPQLGKRIQDARDRLASALSADYPPDTAREIAFHLLDWHTEAAFLVAVQLYPERFTPEELLDGANMLLIHAPNHLAAAAKLSGYPIEDVFEIGVLDAGDPNT
jgi:hypothetical protein